MVKLSCLFLRSHSFIFSSMLQPTFVLTWMHPAKSIYFLRRTFCILLQYKQQNEKKVWCFVLAQTSLLRLFIYVFFNDFTVSWRIMHAISGLVLEFQPNENKVSCLHFDHMVDDHQIFKGRQNGGMYITICDVIFLWLLWFGRSFKLIVLN